MTTTAPRVATSGGADRSLHERLLGGDQDALADIYQRDSSVVFNTALRVTGCRSGAEDVTQGVFLVLWQRPERYDPGRGSLRPWLATVAHHRSTDWVREQSARRRREQRGGAGDVEHLPGIEETVTAMIGAEVVRRAFDGLCEKERTAIGLAYFADRTYRQVAADLGVPEGTVKSRIRSGLQHLAAALHSETAYSDP